MPDARDPFNDVASCANHDIIWPTANGELYDAFDLEKRKNKPNKLVNRIPDTHERL